MLGVQNEEDLSELNWNLIVLCDNSFFAVYTGVAINAHVFQ